MKTARNRFAVRPAATANPAAVRLAAALLAAAALSSGTVGCGPKDPPVSATSRASGRRNAPGTCSCICRQPRHDSFPLSNVQTSDEEDIGACDARCGLYEEAHYGASCERLFRKAEAAAVPVEELARELERTGRPVAQKDSDGDTTPDVQDKCPEVVGPRENDGCPDTDADGDGIVDRNDRCIEQRGPRENAGCPDVDSDGDGVVDRNDRCKAVPESKNGYQDEDGCPDEVPTALAKFTGRIEGIVFKTGSAEIDPKSFGVLEKAGEVLREFPQARLEISGHTDNVGNADKNTDLSRRRAESVKTWLVGKGVADSRLVAAGYGPSQPIADNKSAAGRSQNRRVEFKLLSGALAR